MVTGLDLRNSSLIWSTYGAFSQHAGILHYVSLRDRMFDGPLASTIVERAGGLRATYIILNQKRHLFPGILAIRCEP